MNRRRSVAVVLVVVALVVVTLVVAETTRPEGVVEVDDPQPRERTLDYWTDERIQEAEPTPLPTVGD